jgi:hypothetical protein
VPAGKVAVLMVFLLQFVGTAFIRTLVRICHSKHPTTDKKQPENEQMFDNIENMFYS